MLDGGDGRQLKMLNRNIASKYCPCNVEKLQTRLNIRPEFSIIVQYLGIWFFKYFIHICYFAFYPVFLLCALPPTSILDKGLHFDEGMLWDDFDSSWFLTCMGVGALSSWCFRLAT